MPLGTGTLPQDPQRAACRFEMRGGIEGYCQAAAVGLAPDGWVSLVMDAVRPERYEAAFRDAGLTLRRVILVRPYPGRPPTYLVYQGGLGGAFEGETEIVVRGDDGEYTEEYNEVIGRIRQP